MTSCSALPTDKTPLSETFKKTDDILFQAVKGIAELISVKGLINLDFADVKTVMHNKGMALMGIGIGEGKNRVVDAVSQAISSPLLENTSIKGATGIIVNITGSCDLSLTEVNQAISLLTEEADPDAEIIVGAVIDDNKKDSLSLTVIATGFEEENPYLLEEEPHTRIQWSHKPFIQKQSARTEREIKQRYSEHYRPEMEAPASKNDTVTLEPESSRPYQDPEAPPNEMEAVTGETKPEPYQDLKAPEREPEAMETEVANSSAASPQQEPSSAASSKNPAAEPQASISENEALIKKLSPHNSSEWAEQADPDIKTQNFSGREEEDIKDSSKNPGEKNTHLTPREILLSKVKEYRQKQKLLKQSKKSPEEIQQTSLSLDTEKTSETLSDNDSLLFETEVGFSPEDIS